MCTVHIELDSVQRFLNLKKCDRTGIKGFQKKPGSNLYMENRHINFKKS
jgi:hypothetical protein